jgi:hypothetical protein
MKVALIRIATVANLFMVASSIGPPPAPSLLVFPQFDALTNENGPTSVLEKLQKLSEINGALANAATTQRIFFANPATIFTNFKNNIFP